MTIRKLIIELSKVADQDRVVVVAGNGDTFHLMTNIGTTMYNDDDGEIGLEELTEADREQGYTEEDVITGVKAVVLE